jgi:hypothetical protein
MESKSTRTTAVRRVLRSILREINYASADYPPTKPSDFYCNLQAIQLRFHTRPLWENSTTRMYIAIQECDTRTPTILFGKQQSTSQSSLDPPPALKENSDVLVSPNPNTKTLARISNDLAQFVATQKT